MTVLSAARSRHVLPPAALPAPQFRGQPAKVVVVVVAAVVVVVVVVVGGVGGVVVVEGGARAVEVVLFVVLGKFPHTSTKSWQQSPKTSQVESQLQSSSSPNPAL